MTAKSFDPVLLLNWLRCSRSKSPLVRDGDSLVCTGPACRLRFAIHQDIPNMLVEEAVEVSKVEWSAIVEKSNTAV